MSVEWSLHGADPNSFLQPCDRGLSLLHAAAALGYTRLVFTLIQWKRENPSTVLDLEINPLKLDDFGLTPLEIVADLQGNFGEILMEIWSKMFAKT
ncbi:unnamed protein product [Allacma fusca]|uniref:Uncharacterized protein n=1 Tax=Allacma fusca TaxID=39272 RepID=A0A8J2P8D6_9HEXA|nr:unnamed protein product [Allacma fusca]